MITVIEIQLFDKGMDAAPLVEQSVLSLLEGLVFYGTPLAKMAYVRVYNADENQLPYQEIPHVEN